jgi:hypothetical protein
MVYRNRSAAGKHLAARLEFATRQCRIFSRESCPCSVEIVKQKEKKKG